MNATPPDAGAVLAALEWIAPRVSNRYQSYTRRVHAYPAGELRSVCGRANRGGMNGKKLSAADLQMRRPCAICGAITEGLAQPAEEHAQRLASSDVPERRDDAIDALYGAPATAFTITAILGTTAEGVARYTVIEHPVAGEEVARIVYMTSRTASRVEFITHGTAG